MLVQEMAQIVAQSVAQCGWPGQKQGQQGRKSGFVLQALLDGQPSIGGQGDGAFGLGLCLAQAAIGLQLIARRVWRLQLVAAGAVRQGGQQPQMPQQQQFKHAQHPACLPWHLRQRTARFARLRQQRHAAGIAVKQGRLRVLSGQQLEQQF